MPRVSFASADLVDVSFGITEGSVEIVSAISKVHQYPQNRKTGVQGDPFPCVQIQFAHLDPKTGQKTDAEPATMEFGIGSLDKFHPGKVTGPDDEDPEDLGDEVGTEGNTLYPVEDGNRITKSSKWSHLVVSMEQLGFKPEVLGTGYLPSLVGTKGHVKTVTLPKFDNTREKEPTALVFDKITQFPYEKKGTAPKPAPAKPGTTKPASGKPASAPPAAPATEEADTDEINAIATTTLSTVAEKNGGSEMARTKLKSQALTTMLRAKVNAKNQKAVNELFASDEWLTEACENLGIGFDADSGTITFPDNG